MNDPIPNFLIKKITSSLPVVVRKILRILAFALTLPLLSCSPPAIATDAEVIRLNNQGVKALNKEDYDLAIEIFKQALKLDPDYTLAKMNLSIVFNDAGFKFRHIYPDRSLRYFHEAVFFYPFNSRSQPNLDAMLVILGRDPDSFYDRAILGLQSELEEDSTSAIVEYWSALKIRPDAELERKLELLRRSVQKDGLFFEDSLVSKSSENNQKLELPPGSIQRDKLFSSYSLVSKSSENETDQEFESYMRGVQFAIKRNWNPPKLNLSNRIVLHFNVSQSGIVSDVKVRSSSGSQSSDAAAIAAVKKASPLSPPPIVDPNVEIQFTFDYNSFVGSKDIDDRTKDTANLWHRSRVFLPIIRP
jgi:TonB family protein